MGFSSIMGACAVRLSRLNADGSPAYGSQTGSFCVVGGISTFEHDFEIQKGADIFEEDACGGAVVIRRRPDRVKFATFKLTMAKTDYRIDEITGVATLITSGGNPIGRAFQAAQGCGGVAFGNGVTLELWSEQWDCDAFLASAPYMVSLLERCYLTPNGYKRSNGVALPQYDGFAVVDPNFGSGPFGLYQSLVGVPNVVYAELDAQALPTCATPPNYAPLIAHT